MNIYTKVKHLSTATGLLTAIALSVTACSPIAAGSSILADDAMPPFPAPHLVTYVLDLSTSTFPEAQMQALSAGIGGYVDEGTLGDPFASPAQPPTGLAVQFITANSAQAPRVLLATAKTGADLYRFAVEQTNNIEGAMQLWQGFRRARKAVSTDPRLLESRDACLPAALAAIGRQQLLDEVLMEPAGAICDDAASSYRAVMKMQELANDPGVELGSDVEGAILSALQNTEHATTQFPSATGKIVIASDLIDAAGLRLNATLAGLSDEEVCLAAVERAERKAAFRAQVSVSLVGTRNSIADPKILDQVATYWRCYLQQMGITNITEQTDLAGF